MQESASRLVDALESCIALVIAFVPQAAQFGAVFAAGSTILHPLGMADRNLPLEPPKPAFGVT